MVPKDLQSLWRYLKTCENLPEFVRIENEMLDIGSKQSPEWGIGGSGTWGFGGCGRKDWDADEVLKEQQD